MITISIASVSIGWPKTEIYRDRKAAANLLISDGSKSKIVPLYLHDTPDKSAMHSGDEAEIRRVAQATIDDPIWRKRIEGWL